MADRAPHHAWSGLPVYQCRWCQYDRVDDAATVDRHEQWSHAEQYIAALYAEDAAKTAAPDAPPSPSPSPIAAAPDAPHEG